MANIQTPKNDTYAGWLALLDGKDSKRIGHNTYAEKLNDDEIGIRLHGTYVVTFVSDGRIVLRSGGYETVTTKQRMNAVLPMCFRVFAKDYTWKVRDRSNVRDNGERVLSFFDGLTLTHPESDAT